MRSWWIVCTKWETQICYICIYVCICFNILPTTNIFINIVDENLLCHIVLEHISLSNGCMFTGSSIMMIYVLYHFNELHTCFQWVVCHSQNRSSITTKKYIVAPPKISFCTYYISVALDVWHIARRTPGWGHLFVV